LIIFAPPPTDSGKLCLDKLVASIGLGVTVGPSIPRHRSTDGNLHSPEHRSGRLTWGSLRKR
jgi:hypothetical protein